MTRCDECGFDWDGTGADAAAEVRAAGTRFAAPLTRFLAGEDGDRLLRARPEPDVWSALEYAAHMRDALGFYADRVSRVLTEDRPQLEAFGFDAACDERRYNEEDVARVVARLQQAAEQLADVLDSLDEESWRRVGIGSDGDERTVLVLARRAAHEAHHHLLDVGRGLRRLRAAR